MQKIIINRGLPASGKSTYAKKLVLESEGKLKRINRDDIREMIDSSVWSKENEKNVVRVRNILLDSFIRNGYDVIIDDTNLDKKVISDIQSILINLSIELKRDFEVYYKWHEISLDESLSRNSFREGRHRIPDDAIKNMYNKYNIIDPNNPIKKDYKFVIDYKSHELKDLHLIQRSKIVDKCIVCDIDGTLAIMGDRSPYEWHNVGIDLVNEPVKKLLSVYWEFSAMGGECYSIILISGRDEVCRHETEKWLDRNEIKYDELFMRKQNDNRKDSIVKEEIYVTDIYPNYDVKFWLDDRNAVVDTVRNKLNLPCFQVNYSPD